MAYPVPTSIGSYVGTGYNPKPPRPRVARPTPIDPLGGIATNPAVLGADLARQQTLGDANALLNQQRSQSLISFGDPGLARTLGLNVDPNTAAAAQANQFSTTANLAHSNEIQGRRILNNLAGRGILHSGELGYQQGEQARGYGQASYDAASQLLGNLNQQLSGYQQTTQGAQNNYLNALLQAFGVFGQNPLGVPGG